jgi:hypothetical protein
MKVKSLMNALKSCDPEANVVMAFQPHWPVETMLTGIAVRKDIRSVSQDHEGAEQAPLRSGGAMTDVVLVQGDFLRQGSADAWEAARPARSRR